jgi:hypothetical protein
MRELDGVPPAAIMPDAIGLRKALPFSRRPAMNVAVLRDSRAAEEIGRALNVAPVGTMAARVVPVRLSVMLPVLWSITSTTSCTSHEVTLGKIAFCAVQNA